MDDDDQVIVIGSGPCGAAAAKRLVESGVRVTMLDAGLQAPPGLLARVAGRTIWRRKGWAEYAEHRLDAASDDDLMWVSSLSLGGLSNYWTAAVPRYAPEDFVDGARIDERFAWPVTYDDLVPYYELIESSMGLTVGDAIRGVPSGRSRYRHQLPADWQAVAGRAEEHGHGLGAVPMARGRPSMVARRGTEFSSYQCMVRPLEQSPSFRLVTGAYVTRLVWSSSSGRVTSVEYVDRRTGDRQLMRGRAVVLAAGAIDSTVILLRSTSDDFPAGLGNSAGLIGRYLHDHPREWWPLEIPASMTALAHPVYIARTDHADSEPLTGASLTVGMTESLRDRLRTFYGGRTTSFGVQVLGTMVPTPDAGVVLGVVGRIAAGPPSPLRQPGRADHDRGARTSSRGVGIGRGTRRRAGTVPRADARIVGSLRGHGEDAPQPRVRRARPLEPHLRGTERRRRRRQLLPDGSGEEPHAHRHGLGGAGGRSLG